MNIAAITLDSLASIQHAVSFNEIAAAMSSAVLFGVKQSKTNGLNLTLYGGVFPTDAGPVQIADQKIALTASATNYISVNTVGTVSKVTAAPAGWPGPMDSGARALYELTVGTNAITSGTCYIVGAGSKGSQGQIGATGAGGNELWQQRKRVWMVTGAGSTQVTVLGFNDTGGVTARSLGTATFRETIPYAAVVASTNTANSVGSLWHSENLYFFGNAAGRGGFDISMRWCRDTSFTATTEGSFIGLYDVSSGTPTDVEASTLINVIGVGADGGDSNLSLIHNDGSGSATKTTLGANFPARATNNVYELTLSALANGTEVTWSLLDAGTGNTTSGVISSNLPSNTTFLTWVFIIRNGATAANCIINAIQVIGNSRY